VNERAPRSRAPHIDTTPDAARAAKAAMRESEADEEDEADEDAAAPSA
jgi:hypothetical protein